jgi:23S rRNA (adenine2503-C2)-methyltransferase
MCEREAAFACTSPRTRTVYDFTCEELAAWLEERGEARYRARQVLDWAYGKKVARFDDMTSLPRSLRKKLAEELEIGPLPVVARADGRHTTKLLLELLDGERIECVSMQTPWGGTACLSTQVGCPVGCLFCASGATGMVRNLSAPEIVRQIISLARTGAKISHVVFMGMGEPLLNYDAVVKAMEAITDRDRLGLSPRHVTVGTAGVVPRIVQLARDAPAKLELAVSLGAPVDDLRRTLMPGVAKWPLSELMAACDEWTSRRGGQPVTYAYVLVGGVNDSLKIADQLARLLKRRRHHVNLIRMNPVEHCNLRPSTKEQTLRFMERLRQAGVNVSLRRSRGRDIRAACGQLRRQTCSGQ